MGGGIAANINDNPSYHNFNKRNFGPPAKPVAL
jgi:hypothetical protein